jgi:hypothetical protein
MNNARTSSSFSVWPPFARYASAIAERPAPFIQASTSASAGVGPSIAWLYQQTIGEPETHTATLRGKSENPRNSAGTTGF